MNLCTGRTFARLLGYEKQKSSFNVAYARVNSMFRELADHLPRRGEELFEYDSWTLANYLEAVWGARLLNPGRQISLDPPTPTPAPGQTCRGII
jgi:hypothetical protein